MDHYEELGLPRSASQEEIRQAYRRVARLLHPDRCADDEGRRLADLQMKRLNGIVAVLTDPAARASYDQGLLADTKIPCPPARRGRFFGRLAWPVAAALLILFLAWALPHGKPPGPAIQPTAEPATAGTSQPEPAPRLHRTFHAPRRVAAPPSFSPILEPPPAVPALTDAAAPETRELPLALPPPPTPAPVASAPSAVADGLAGEWLYVPPVRAKSNGLYPIEYIELRMTEESGVLRGSYRARYRVSDRAISPNVAFQFRGRAGADGGSLPWVGTAGAQGQLTLRRLASGALEVSWFADRLGAELGLVSGSATLVRKQE